MSNKNDRWSALSLKDRADLMNMYITNGISDLKEMKRHYNSFAPGGPIETDEYGYPADITPAVVTQDAEFNKFLMTLPDNQRLTPEEDYHTYQYWKINGKPKDFSEALNLEMYHYDSSDNSYHSNSVAFDNKGVGHFMKPKHHPTIKYELDWYNKGVGTLEGGEQYPLQGEERKEWEDFRSQYQLDSTGVDYKYVPKKHYNSFGDGSWKDTALLGASFIPYVGTGIDIYNLIKDPSWENAGWAALSLGSDVLGLTALKGLAKSAKLAKGVKAVKALEQAKTAEKYTEAVRKGLQLERTGNPKKIALAAGRRGQSYYDNLVATRQLRDATIRAENLAAKSKILDTTDKTIDFYGNVINEKEALKELLYANGGRILDDTEEEQTLSGVSVDTSKPILNREQYLQQQRDNVRVKALQNSLNRTEPSNPVFENSQSQEEWEQDRLARIDYLVTRLYNAQTDEESEMLNLGIRGIENETYSPIMFGNNCIYTALDNYGKKYKVPGNLSFLANPGKYGFKEIKTSDIKPGDLVQKILTGNNHHMMVFDSYDDNGLPLYNYSSSQSKTASDIKKKSHYYGENINDNNTYRAFTFIGNAEDNDVWNNDYNQYRKDYSSKILEELKNVPSLSKDFIKTNKEEKLLTKRK